MKSSNRNWKHFEENGKYDRIYIIFPHVFSLTIWILHNYYLTYSSVPCQLMCCWHPFFFSYQDCFSAFSFSFSQYHYDVNCWCQNIISIYPRNTETRKKWGEMSFSLRESPCYIISQIIFQNNCCLDSFLQNFVGWTVDLKILNIYE